MLDNLTRFARYWSTWVLAAFAGLGTAVSQGLVGMPAPLKDALYEALPWLKGYEAYLWLAAFLVTFYKARVTPQGIDATPKENPDA